MRIPLGVAALRHLRVDRTPADARDGGPGGEGGARRDGGGVSRRKGTRRTVPERHRAPATAAGRGMTSHRAPRTRPTPGAPDRAARAIAHVHTYLPRFRSVSRSPVSSFSFSRARARRQDIQDVRDRPAECGTRGGGSTARRKRRAVPPRSPRAIPPRHPSSLAHLSPTVRHSGDHVASALVHA